MIELFPAGFEEVEREGELELAVYTDGSGDERLEQAFGGVRARDVDEGWHDRWRSFHRPVRIGPLWVGPPWEEPASGAVAVVIDPGRAFGTGAHATTRLCLHFLLELERGSVLDIGCGSGVLAIAAAKLGFSPAKAVDHDPLAVEATMRNAALNGVEIDVRRGDALERPLPSSHVAVANIDLARTQALASRVDAAHVVTSGYLMAAEPPLRGHEHRGRRCEGGWAADLFGRPQPARG